MLCFVNISDVSVMILDHENFNLDDIVTPVKAEVLREFLVDSGYDKQKTQFLYEGFSCGFSLNYKGPLTKVQRFSPNLKLRVGSPIEL